MSDIQNRDVPDDVVTAIDARAAAVGLSRNEYLRRRLAQDSRVGARRVTLDGECVRCVGVGSTALTISWDSTPRR